MRKTETRSAIRSYDINLVGRCLLALACSVAVASAAHAHTFTGKFSGTGRACNGMLHVHSQTIEWRSSFSRCARSRYEVLDMSRPGEPGQMAFRFKTRSAKCLYEVVALEQVDGTDWTADGYPSLEAYQKKDAPGWQDSPLPARLVLECPTTQLR
ncbi:hypothetical protein [Variovorax sp. YR752]|uniref:hypothetical protein n=1 Tax=Variovorax sp. YR752 TaxID=1884383 RepID=UPI0031380D7A